MKKLVEFGLKYKAVMSFITALMIIGGIYSFFALGRLEDPAFSVKSALVVTTYPGATPEEVANEVTDRLETVIQQLPQVKHILSISREGMSYIKVDVKDRYWSKDLPQVWDELRRKVSDAEIKLPPGADKPKVVDDFGFVFGFLLALTGEGFNYAQLEDYAETIQKELYLVSNIARIDLWGVQQRAIYMDIPAQKFAELSLTPQTIQQTLHSQNMVVNAGGFDENKFRIPMQVTGGFKTPADLGQLVLHPLANDIMQGAFVSSQSKEATGQTIIDAMQKSQQETFRLSDLANIYPGYKTPPLTMMRYNGKPAIGIQVAGMEDSNIVTVGQELDAQIKAIQASLPAGLELHKISWQAQVVKESISGFVISMIESVIIVLIVLMIPSGFRMGSIIGADLLLTILATLIFMYAMQIPLERMSLGALIIAMGMMVDNSIVIADGIAVKMRQGKDKFTAAVEATAVPALPLLSATIIAVMSFYPIFASEGGTGEYCRTLFTIVGISLMVSWLIAVLITPQQCISYLKIPEKQNPEQTQSAEFNTPFYKNFRRCIALLMKHRYITVGVLVAALILSLVGFQYVVKLFFPFSTRPQLMIDYWAPAGTKIQDVQEKAASIEREFLSGGNIESVTTFIGAGSPRFYLPVDPEFYYQNYAQLIVNFKSYSEIDPFIAKYEKWLNEQYPEGLIRIRKYNVGPGNAWKFELRILGPSDADPKVLRKIGNDFLNIVKKSPVGTEWKLDVMNPVQELAAEYDQSKGRWADIGRNDIAEALKRSYDGFQVGLFREKNHIYPILLRATDTERKEFFSHFDTLPTKGQFSISAVPLAQVLDTHSMEWTEPYVIRWDRHRQVAVQGSPLLDKSFVELRQSVLNELNAYPLPEGYSLFWGGEQDSSSTAQQQLLPGFIPAIVIILFCLVAVFNSFKPIMVILCTIPFALIGISISLLALHVPFGFMALLGTMSLAGMMNKNIVVLLDACNENLANGMDHYHAIIEAAVTRARPVLLAAGTTVLGVIPLLQDIFWIGLAVAIMGGLALGSLLTLGAVPVFYAIFYGLKDPEKEPS